MALCAAVFLAGCSERGQELESSGSETSETDADTSATASEESSDNRGPAARDDEYVTRTDEVFSVEGEQGLLANDVDPEGAPLLVRAEDIPSEQGGEVRVGEDGRFRYTPPDGYWGPDGFAYTVEDEQGATASARVSLHLVPSQIELAELTNGTGGFVLDGEPSDNAGEWTGAAGDVNRDGLDDLIIAAPALHSLDAPTGRSYIVFGGARPGLATLGGLADGGYVIEGGRASERVGWSGRGAGDVNGDGIDDVILGTWPLNKPGRAYVIFSDPDTTGVDLNRPGAGFAIVGGNTGAQLGRSVSAAGDVNGDGFADVIVGAPLDDPGELPMAGRSYVIFGGPEQAPVDVAALGDRGFTIVGTYEDYWSGYSVSGAGDVNGDGLDDVIVGTAAGGPEYEGEAYVVFGKTTSDTVETGALGSNGFLIRGTAPFESVGESVSGAGDLNGDGLADLVIGARSEGEDGTGGAYVVFGKGGSDPIELSNLDAGGFLIADSPNEEFVGQHVAGIGDFNGDGIGDVVVGAVEPDGRMLAFVVFGKADPSRIALDDLQDRGILLRGEQASFGIQGAMSVSRAGDVNGDGLADVVMGDPYQGHNGEYAGRAYVVFGLRTTVP